MQNWKRRFQQFWMSTDDKPKGKDSRYIEKQTRQDAKREIQAYVSEHEAADEIAWSEEVDQAWKCYQAELDWYEADYTEPYTCHCFDESPEDSD